MFDDLHDPNPPDADMATLAAVSSRAKAIRQRRMALTGSLAAGLIAVVGVTVVLTRDDDPGSVSITENPVTTEAPVVTGPGQTDPSQTGPGQTDPNPTDPGPTDPDPSIAPSTDPPVDCPAVGLTYVGSGLSAALVNEPQISDGFTTDDVGPIRAERRVTIVENGTEIQLGRFFPESAPAEVPIEEVDGQWVARADKGGAWVVVQSTDRDRVECLMQTILYEPLLDLAEAQGERQLTAIDGNGDAVVLSWNGKPTVLHDGTDPDDPPPLEGETTAVDGVAVPFLGDEAWVGICCEPVAGTLLRADIGTLATYDDADGFGHAPTLSHDDRYLAAIDYLGVQIRDLETDETILIDLQAEDYQQADRVVWLAADVIAVQISTSTTSSIAVYSVFDGSATEVSRTVVASGSTGFEPLISVVGASGPAPLEANTEPVAWFWSSEEALLVAHPMTTLLTGGPIDGGSALRQVGIPGDATVVSVVGTEVRWVDESRRLWRAPLADLAAAELVRGQFIWVR
jgi:hypothetical protein